MRETFVFAVVLVTAVSSTAMFFALHVDRTAPLKWFWAPWAIIVLGAAVANLLAWGLRP